MPCDSRSESDLRPDSQPGPDPDQLRAIRSFTLRQGRLTQAQRRALETLWPVFGLDERRPFDARQVFGRDAAVVAEVGFGNGETLAEMAAAQPDTDFVGIEVHRPGVGHLLLRVNELGLTNVRVYCADAVQVLRANFPDHGLAGINVFFPDPWPKKRHHKRRLVNPDFVRLAAQKLRRGGIFHAATDWEDYAHWMSAVLQVSQDFENGSGLHSRLTDSQIRPETRFEKRGRRLGHAIWDLVFVRR